MAVLLFGAFVLESAMGLNAHRWVVEHAGDVEGFSFALNHTVELNGLFPPLVLLVMAEVFLRGSRLEASARAAIAEPAA